MKTFDVASYTGFSGFQVFRKQFTADGAVRIAS
jgi:hypothetical protein